MAFWFGDGFDLYTAITDCGTYWDASFGGSATLALSASGRFAGSRGLTITGGVSPTSYLTKTSGANDAVHHFVVAVQQTATFSGTAAALFITLFDGSTAQCSIAFRSDGAIILTSGAANGTTLATYTGAVAAINTWYAFEIEVVVNSTTGSMSVRKNGNTSNDFTLGSLNTRNSANNYANKIGVGSNWTTTTGVIADDFLWRSDASSVAWVGDIRCFTRMPAADSAVAWTRSQSSAPVNTVSGATATNANSSGFGRYNPFVPPWTGTVGSVTLSFTVAATANFKCSIFSSVGGQPAAVLGSATVLANPGVGVATWTFTTPVSVTAGTQYWVGMNCDASSGTITVASSGSAGWQNTLAYASFPAANPSGLSAANSPAFVVQLGATQNAQMVEEPQQDGATTYVYSSTVGQSDLYTIGAIGSTPTGVLAVTTRGYVQKSDAGTRLAAVQIQSGATNAQATPLALPAGSWAWNWRTDLVDPNTSASWTAVGVSNALVGAVVTG